MSDDTRDKVIALEVEVRQLRAEVKELTSVVERLVALLNQAKGAKWSLGLLLFVGGAVSTYAPSMVRWLMTPK